MADTKSYTQGLYIDDEYFDIPLVSIKRTADFLEKYAERNEAGTVLIETIGVYYNYTVKVGYIESSTMYKKLFETLTNPNKRFHTVKLPDGANWFTFYGYFSSISDEISKVLDDDVKFESLSFKMTSRSKTK